MTQIDPTPYQREAAADGPEHHNPFIRQSRLANNYTSIPLNIIGSQDEFLWDANGKPYIDGLSGYGAVNFGHLNDRAVGALIRQIQSSEETKRVVRSGNIIPGVPEELLKNATTGDLVSRNWTARLLENYAYELAEFMRMDRALPMDNGGVGAVEALLKLARRWGNYIKKIPEPQIVTFDGCFHGRSFGAMATSNDEEHMRAGFGPHLDGFITGVAYGDLNALEAVLVADAKQKGGPRIAAVLMELLQGEAGVRVSPKTYHAGAQQLCKKFNVLFCVDEIQTGYGRTGLDFASDSLPERPAIIATSKAQGAGLLACSAITAKKEIMDLFDPGSHGATYSGNPLACAVGMETIKIMREGKMQELSIRHGHNLLNQTQALDYGFIEDIRGPNDEGYWLGVELKTPSLAHEFSLRMVLDHHVACKDAHATVRISPPFTIRDEYARHIGDSIIKTAQSMQTSPSPRAPFLE
jgi:ornithine--oxo-acid transaminase